MIILYFSAEPLKKKKRIDPTILKERAEKRIRRMQRDIRRLEKVAKKYKPISELEVPRKIYRDRYSALCFLYIYNISFFVLNDLFNIFNDFSVTSLCLLF